MTDNPAVPGRRLAFLGGDPAFSAPLHVGRPNIGNQEQFMRYAEGILNCRWLSNNGPLVRQLENELRLLFDVKHCVAFCNATIALQVAVRALGLSGEVILPSFAFVATAHALQWLGITPVLCDIDPVTQTLDPVCVADRITARTTGIVGVHLWGRPCAIDDLQRVADRHGLKLLFDAAHAPGCTYRGRKIGGFGSAEVFSLHATKFLNSFEGGAIATNDDDLAEQFRLMRDFGFDGYDHVVCVGVNGKMSEISAAMGLANLGTIDEIIQADYRNYIQYQHELSAIPGLSLLRYDEGERCNYQYVVAMVDPQHSGLSRDDLIRVLHSENVLARRYFWPGCHRMEPYRALFPDAYRYLPQTEYVADRVLVLPTGTSVGEAEIVTIAGVLRSAIADAPTIRRHLTA